MCPTKIGMHGSVGHEIPDIICSHSCYFSQFCTAFFFSPLTALSPIQDVSSGADMLWAHVLGL